MFFLILTIIATAVSQVNASQAEAELYRTLMKNYSAVVRPVRNPNKVLTVSMKVFLQQILNVDEQDQVIEVNAWLKYIWNDYRLRWRPLAFDNISSVRFPGDEQQIWQPDILLYNRHAILSYGLKFDDINAVFKAPVEAITRRHVQYLEGGHEVHYSVIPGAVGETSMMEKLNKRI
ncbi:hypothetical protein Y032_0296g1685 [Ancylostoma ceylanicum]|uniref:Neurotransmitter-gated ion-channel ligand-binding domain-containing protein n=1 Tax=Ancylostoma ceylanicum TaxID=53326 RepID=A0A016S4I6_9BILA|nr:hypothetical protein Y032_0296g1685 [Ancylostoma ceylanicum]